MPQTKQPDPLVLLGGIISVHEELESSIEADATWHPAAIIVAVAGPCIATGPRSTADVTCGDVSVTARCGARGSIVTCRSLSRSDSFARTSVGPSLEKGASFQASWRAAVCGRR